MEREKENSTFPGGLGWLRISSTSLSFLFCLEHRRWRQRHIQIEEPVSLSCDISPEFPVPIAYFLKKENNHYAYFSHSLKGHQMKF